MVSVEAAQPSCELGERERGDRAHGRDLDGPVGAAVGGVDDVGAAGYPAVAATGEPDGVEVVLVSAGVGTPPGRAAVDRVQQRVGVARDPHLTRAERLDAVEPVVPAHEEDGPVQAAVDCVQHGVAADRPAHLRGGKAHGRDDPGPPDAHASPRLAAVDGAIDDRRAARMGRAADRPAALDADERDRLKGGADAGLHGEGDAAVRGVKDVAAADQPAVRGVGEVAAGVAFALRQGALPLPAAVARRDGQGGAAQRKDCQTGRGQCDSEPEQSMFHEDPLVASADHDILRFSKCVTVSARSGL